MGDLGQSTTTKPVAVVGTRKKLSVSPSAIGRFLANDRDSVIPKEIVDASLGQRKSVLKSYRENVDVLSRVDEFEVWCAGDPKQTRSLLDLLIGMGVRAHLLNERVTGLRQRQGEGLCVHIGDFEGVA